MSGIKAWITRLSKDTRLKHFCTGQVSADLLQLNPGGEEGALCAQYITGKVLLTIKILAAGFVIGVAAKYTAGKSGVLFENTTVRRGNYQNGIQKVEMVADDGVNTMSFEVEIRPRILEEAEVETLYQEFSNNLKSLLIQDGSDFEHISGDLKLSEFYEGYPFEIVWSSSRPEIIDPFGYVNRVSEKEKVVLEMEISYQAWKKTETLEVTVIPPELTPQELLYEQLTEQINIQEASDRTKDSWELPTEWEGRNLKWKVKGQDYSLLIWALTPAIAIAIFFCTDRDLHKKIEQKQNGLRIEYPEMVHKLVLYIGAGLSVRNAFEKIAKEYSRRKIDGGKASPASEEVLVICRQLQTGILESQAYIQFGKRTGLREYIRLSTLLVQNQKRGNSELLPRLLAEAEKASEEKLLHVKRLSEEAETKLLVPMVMLLAVIMVIIMIPAFGII